MNWKFIASFFVLTFNSLIALTCSAPTVISDLRENAIAPSVAINAQGKRAVAWIGIRGLQDCIQVSFKNDQEIWASPASLFEEKLENKRLYCLLDESGNSYVAWKKFSQTDAINLEVNYLEKRGENPWSGPLSFQTKVYCTDNHFAFDGADKFVFLDTLVYYTDDRFSFYDTKKFIDVEKVVFHDIPEIKNQKRTAQIRVKTGENRELETLLIPETASFFSSHSDSTPKIVGINQMGDVFVVWTVSDTLYGSWLLPNNSFSKAEKISTGFGFSETYLINIVIDTQKNVTIVGIEDNTVQAITRHHDQWSSWTPLSEKNKIDLDFMVNSEAAIDTKGNILMIWKEENVIRSRYKPFGKEWIAMEDIRCKGMLGSVILRFDNISNFIVVWDDYKSQRNASVCATTFLSETQTWSSIQSLSPKGEFCSSPSLEFSKTGCGIFAWTKLSPNFNSFCIEVMEISL